MKTVTGDLIDLAIWGAFDVIVHGCNCRCAMGAGIAARIKANFPEAWKADQGTIKGDRKKLGTITVAEIDRDGQRLVVVNAYTQLDYRGPQPRVDYDALRSAMREVARRFPDSRIGYPKIGAGLAGGDWNQIAKIIDEELAGLDHTLVVYEGGA